MSYLDRLRTCDYRSPSGATFTMQFDDIERNGSSKTAVHELPQQDKPDIQDLGNNADRFPMSLYFTGADYDQKADAFVLALKERGAGALSHPRFGDIPVKALTWSQSESFVENMGRADFSVEFIHCPTTVAFPVTTVQQQETIGNLSADASAASADRFVEDFAPIDADDLAACKAAVMDTIQDISDGFAAVTNGIDSAAREINNQISAVESQIDELVAAPAQLFDSMQGIYNTVADLPTKIQEKLLSYAAQMESLADRIFGEPPRTTSQAALATATSSMIMTATAKSTTVGTTASRQEAVRNADSIEAIRTSFQDVVEQSEAAVVGYQADPVAMAALSDTIAKTSDAVLQASFDLRSERRYVLPAETPVLVLLWKFYGSLDALDEFIESNDLQGDENLMVPAGREVLYYVG